MGGEKRVGPIRDHIVETDIDGELSLYDPSTDQVMVLNQTASDIWLLSDGEHTLTQLIDLLAKAYGVNANEIRDDVKRTIASFVENGFIDTGEFG